MKFSINWLREFVDLPKNPEEIADLLTRAGVEIKKIEARGASIDKVVISQIAASSRHPNADRLTVCEVDDGSGTKRQIVCGATNYKVGRQSSARASRTRNCLTAWKFERVNFAALNLKECFAARLSLVLAKMPPVC